MDEPSNNETAHCFVPEILVDFIDKNFQQGKVGLEPASFFINGVCLLVDISGFTKLSGDYCLLGKGGIDDLQLATNGYMGRLVDTIYTYGGEIIKFAGDAIICIFSANFITALMPMRGDAAHGKRRSFCGFGSFELGDSIVMNNAQSSVKLGILVNAEVILRAMHCAQELREIQTEKLSVHVAMSCGEMCFGILGGFENRWECLISGPCIHQLSDCLDEAPSKQAVISAECAQILRDHPAATESLKRNADAMNTVLETEGGTYEFQLEALASGNCRIINVTCENNLDIITTAVKKSLVSASRNNPELTTLIRQFVPVPIAEKLDNAAGLSYLAEIREVTTMFMKVTFAYTRF